MQAINQSAATGPLDLKTPALLAALKRKTGTRRFASNDPRFPPLEEVTRPTVPTDQAAHYLLRQPQTLREWAMTGKVIQPLRINGRLAWPVSELKKILGVAA